MNTDIRIKTSFPNHPKTKKFIKVVGPLGGWMLVKLWVFTSQNKPEGLLTNMDASDISDVMEFKGNPRVLIHALLDCTTGADAMKSCPGCDVCEKAKTKKRAAWLEKTSSGFYRVHDWEEHNPYACKAPARIERAKKGGAARRDKLLKQRLGDSYVAEQAVLDHGTSSAPAPAPVPSPVPSPIERGGEPNRSTTSPRRFDAIAFEKAETAWKEFHEVLLKSPDKIVIDDPISRKIYFDLGPDRIMELHTQKGGHLQQEFITRYSVLEVASFKAKV
jgi:hypothetical protein